MDLQKSRRARPKLISLFTGAGGLDLGLEEAGFDTLVANEVQHYACESLRQNQALSRLAPEDFQQWFENQMNQRCSANLSSNQLGELKSRIRSANGRRQYLRHAKIVEKDIRDLSAKALMDLAKVKPGAIDLIAGGPPCQPFSRAGKRESVTTDTGKLFKDFVRIVDEARPRWFLFENVKGLTLTKTPIARLRCQNCRSVELVSFSDWEQLQVSELETMPCGTCGLPDAAVEWENKAGGTLDIVLNEFQQLGYTCYHTVLNAADFGAPQQRERLFIVGSRDGEDFEWPSPTNQKSSDAEEPSLFVFSELPHWRTMKEVLWPNGHWRYGQLGEKAVLWVKNVVRPHDEPVTWHLARTSPTIGAHQGAKLAVAPFGVPEAQLARQQWHTRGRRQGDTAPVSVEHEYLTDLELLRLQTFPDSWYLFGTRMERAFQIGNAVPPILAQAVGQAILEASGKSIKSVPRTVQMR